MDYKLGRLQADTWDVIHGDKGLKKISERAWDWERWVGIWWPGRLSGLIRQEIRDKIAIDESSRR